MKRLFVYPLEPTTSPSRDRVHTGGTVVLHLRPQHDVFHLFSRCLAMAFSPRILDRVGGLQ